MAHPCRLLLIRSLAPSHSKLFCPGNRSIGENILIDMGNYRTHYSGRAKFRSFVPDSVEVMVENAQPSSLKLLSETDAGFSHLNHLLENASTRQLADVMKREAGASVRLTLPDAPCGVYALDSCALDDVMNVIKATEWGVGQLDTLPLSTRLIKQIHAVAMSSPVYSKKYVGEFRKSPVWIGSPGSTPSTARFVPPVNEDMTEAIGSLEHYIHHHDGSPFVKAAVIHYYFEMIHPFIDGNGRVGRIINTLYLLEAHALSAPALLLSEALLQHPARYYAEIQRVNLTGELHHWVDFYLDELKTAALLTVSALEQS